MKINLSHLVVLCLLSSLAVTPAVSATIDFEDLGVAPGGQLNPGTNVTTSSGGYNFINGTLSTIPDLHFPNGAGSNAVGNTTELLAHDDVIMTKIGGSTFSLGSFAWGSSFLELAFFTVEGSISGGGTVSQTFNPDQNEGTLETFALSSGFTNLVSVTWRHVGGIQGLQNIDNIVVDASAVPEPATLALLGMGLVGLGAARRRKIA